MRVARTGRCGATVLLRAAGDPFHDANASGDAFKTLFVANLEDDCTEDDLKEAFEKYGEIKNVKVIRHRKTKASRRYAFIEFASERDMTRAAASTCAAFGDR